MLSGLGLSDRLGRAEGGVGRSIADTRGLEGSCKANTSTKIQICFSLEHPFIRAQANPPDLSLLITEPYFNLPNIQDVYDQFVFEEYEFDSYYRCTRV